MEFDPRERDDAVARFRNHYRFKLDRSEGLRPSGPASFRHCRPGVLMRRALTCASLVGALVLSVAAQANDRPVVTTKVLELIAAGPVGTAEVELAWSDHLPPYPAELPAAVAAAAEGYSFVARLSPAGGESPRLLRLGVHNTIERGFIVLDDAGRRREFEVLTKNTRLGRALREAGADLSTWSRVGEVPLVIDLPHGGWLLYGANGYRVRPERADGLRIDHVAGTATLGDAFRSPHVREPGASLFGSEVIDAFGPSTGPGCEGLRIDPSRIHTIDVHGLPARPRSVDSGRRSFKPADSTADGVELSAEDYRTLPLPEVAAPGSAVPMSLGSRRSPVKWSAELDGAAAKSLIDALATGLRCVETTSRIDRSGTFVLLSTRPKSLIYTADEEGGWTLSVLGQVGGWRLEDRGFRAAAEALWATGTKGQDEAWARIDQRCPPSLGDARAVRVALGDKGSESWIAEPIGDGRWNWTWSRKSRLPGGSDAAAGTVDGALIDALVAAADDDVTCQTTLVSLSHIHFRVHIPIIIELDDGTTLTLESRSPGPDWLPWSVELGEVRGIQESGAIGRALGALFEGAGTRGSAIHPQ
jgi:hypothetical protein